MTGYLSSDGLHMLSQDPMRHLALSVEDMLLVVLVIHKAIELLGLDKKGLLTQALLMGFQ